MKVLYSIFLGIVQGLTEFLPVSSSGHLTLIKKIFGIDGAEFGMSFDIALHVATLVAVLIVLFRDVFDILRHPICKSMLFWIIATIPAGICGLLFEDAVERLLKSGVILGVCFLITAAVLFFSERIALKRTEEGKTLEELKWWEAGIIGLAQAFAILPGISRSGSTMAAGMFVGLRKDKAINFAFLMSIPVVCGSLLLGVKDFIETPESFDALVVVSGMLAAGISGFFAVKFMVEFFKKRSMKGFSIYLTVIGVLVILDQLVFKVFF